MEAGQIAKLSNPQLKQSLLFLYGYQTLEEQTVESTHESNGVGFNMLDAEILSSFAKQVIEGRELSEKQYNVVRLRLPKYHRQLSDEGWKSITLPQVNPPKGTKKIQADIPEAGWLSLDPGNKGLMFRPARHTYPSKQIKKLGFTRWLNGAWHQHTPRVTAVLVKQVQDMFGTILLDPKIEEALKPKPDKDLPAWVGETFITLHPFQKEAIQRVISSDRLLLALAPRLGKTVVTVIAADVVKAERILVVSPLSLLRDWRKKILQWSPTTKDVAIIYKKNLPVPSRWTVTNYDTLRLHPETFNQTPWDLIIVDETLLIKNRKAKRTQWIFELINKKLPYSKRKEKEVNQEPQVSRFATGIKPPKWVWFLSGAPTSRLYADLWAQLNILDPKQFTSYWAFADNYCIRQPTQWSQYNLVGNQPDAADRIKKDLATIYYPRSHEDVTDIPPLLPESLSVPMSPYQDKMYGTMLDEFMAELADDSRLLAPNMLSQMTRLVQIASNPLLVGGKNDSAKWDALVEMLDFEETPIIVWTSFIETVNQLKLRLGMKTRPIASLTGATKQEDRANIVEAFQQDRIAVLIAHPAVGKYGLDLFNAKSVIYLERGYNADDYYQSRLRVVKVDMKVAPHIIHLLSERKDGGFTIDHIIDQILASRTDATKKLTTAGLRQMIGALK